MGARQAGFTLIEILVAFAILALAMATLIPVVMESTTRTDRAAATEIAVSRAESILSALGRERPLRAGEQTGVYPDGARWSIRATVVPDLLRDTPYPLAVYDVAVTVLWGDRERPQSVSLQTLQLGPKP